MECQCGCGETVSDASFKPGHDQRLRVDLERRAGGIEGLRTLVESFEKGSSGDQARINDCKKEVDDLFKRIDNDQSEYDKQLLTLSSAFLAVSLAFIKDVVPLTDAQHLRLLDSSFILLGLCIALVLVSFQVSISGQLKAKEYWENRQAGTGGRFPNWYAIFIRWLNRFNGFLFVVGVSLLVSFVISNIHSEAKMGSNRRLANDGALIRTPASGSDEERGSLIKAPAKPASTQPSSGGSSGNNQPKNQ
jgi:hypothetical protein